MTSRNQLAELHQQVMDELQLTLVGDGDDPLDVFMAAWCTGVISGRLGVQV